MKKALKIRLLPTDQQISKMINHSGCMRFVYNWGLNNQMKYYEEFGKYKSVAKLGTELTKLKNLEEYSWLYDVSNATLKEALRDLGKAYAKFFNTQKKTPGYTKKTIQWATKKGIKLERYHLNGHPTFKSKKNYGIRFYSRYDKMYFKGNYVNLEKIGKVEFKTNYKIPEGPYSNPRVSFDGKYWYLSFATEQTPEQDEELSNESIGIDLGIKDLAVCSNGYKFKNINKTYKVKQLKKKLKRLQRQLSRKYEMNKEITKGGENRFAKTNNIIKLEKKIKLIHRKLKNIRMNHTHQATNKIVKTKPSIIVVEDLNVKGMMSNKHLSKSIQEQLFYEFTRQLEYKSQRYGSLFLKADRFFPSSKKCSCCGNIKKDLKLKDRVYVCSECNFTEDRDFNASMNLSIYGLEVNT